MTPRFLSIGLALLFASVVSAEDRPNIIYIMSDDMGYSDIGCYGSEISTPNLDGLAESGLRFTQFYNTARCCPTRASLLTGLYPHQAGIGHMMGDYGHEGYRGDLNKNCVTIAEVMKTANYRTYMSGKWHVTPKVDPKSEEEKYNWPRQRGFDRFYGTIHGAGSFFDPNSLTRDNTLISPVTDKEYQHPDGFYYTDAIADNAVRYVREHSEKSADQPFFMYVAFTAAHWPMHARERDIAKYSGKYDVGYSEIRKRRYERMLELGVIDAENTVNWPLDDAWKETENPEWDNRNMEVYAAMIDSMDQGIGRLINALKETNQFENTLILFFQDNGGCAEGYGRRGDMETRKDAPSLEPHPAGYLQTRMEPKQTRDGYPVRTGKGVMAGPADTYIAYGKAWASVSNTPFREYKHWVHEGGISTPLIAHWPAHIQRKGEFEDTPAHLIDLMATAVDLADANYPSEFHDGNKIRPMEGKSLVTAFDGKEIDRDAIYWEHEGNRAIRVGDMKLVAKGANAEWELYDLSEDRSEQNDLALSKPEVVADLSDKWNAWAERAYVLPLTPNRKKKNEKFKKSKLKFALMQGDDLNRNVGPFVQERGISFSAELADVSDGVLVAQGGVTHGWGVYVKDNILTAAMTVAGKRTELQSIEQIRGGGTVEFQLHKNGLATAIWNGKLVLAGEFTGMLPVQPQDGLQIGRDEAGNVGNYEVPFSYKSDIVKVEITLEK